MIDRMRIARIALLAVSICSTAALAKGSGEAGDAATFGKSECAILKDLSAEVYKEQPVIFTPLTTVCKAGKAYAIPADTYIRVHLESVPMGHDDTRIKDIPASITRNNHEYERFAYSERPWLKRLFVDKHFSINATFKIATHNFSATIPLASMDHVSGHHDGETFSRTVRYEAMDYPAFLVSTSTASDTATMSFELRGSEQTSSSAAATALKAALTIAKTTAQGSVITALSQQTSTGIATAIDTTINQLFSTNLDESHQFDGNLKQWHDFYLIMKIPSEDGMWEDAKEYYVAGIWEVHFSDPRLSIFAENTCENLEATGACSRTVQEKTIINALAGKTGDILGFNLIGATPIGQISSWVKQLGWWADANKAASGTPAQIANGPAASADTICRRLGEDIATLGLSSLDAHLIIRAVLQSSLVTDPIRKAASASALCTDDKRIQIAAAGPVSVSATAAKK